MSKVLTTVALKVWSTQCCLKWLGARSFVPHSIGDDPLIRSSRLCETLGACRSVNLALYSGIRVSNGSGQAYLDNLGLMSRQGRGLSSIRGRYIPFYCIVEAPYHGLHDQFGSDLIPYIDTTTNVGKSSKLLPNRIKIIMVGVYWTHSTHIPRKFCSGFNLCLSSPKARSGTTGCTKTLPIWSSCRSAPSRSFEQQI